MRPTPDRRRPGDERGVVTVLFALVSTVLMIMLAIVIDLGNMRSIRRDVQADVDLAALAAGEKLRTFDAVGGCEAAVRYLRINIEALPNATSVPCNSLPSTCDDASTAPVTVEDSGTAAPWSVRITYPVADADIADPDVPGDGLRVDDGTPCERIGVEVDRTTDGYFSGIVGLKSYALDAWAVSRRTHDQRTRVPNLWLLEPFECDAMIVTGTAPNDGSAKVKVGSSILGGLVTLDSDGSKSCTGTARTLDVQSNDSKLYLEVFPTYTEPPGEITLHALKPGQLTCNQSGGNQWACDQSDVDSGRMKPQPAARAERATRALVDHRYNCLPSYPRYPNPSGISIAGCTAGRDPYVKQLRDAVALGLTSGPPAGYNLWSAQYSCSEPFGVPAGGLAGNWWVDCPGGLTIDSSDVNFTGGNVIFTGGVQLSGGALRANTANTNPALPASCDTTVTNCLDQSSPDAGFVYIGGQLKSTGQAVIDFRRSAVIQDGGTLSLQGQSPPSWTSPKDGAFENLSLWSEHAGSGYRINGGANMLLEGIFFTPYAYPFEISGGGGQGALQAQFISRTLKISGGGTLWLEPAGAGFIHLPPAAAVLIR